MKYALVTKERQKLYESLYLNNKKLKNEVPSVCGYYGRECPNMGELADARICKRCSLSKFILTVEEIIKKCEYKERLGIQHLYDSDIRDIYEELERQGVDIDYSYVEILLNYFTQD